MANVPLLNKAAYCNIEPNGVDSAVYGTSSGWEMTPIKPNCHLHMFGFVQAVAVILLPF